MTFLYIAWGVFITPLMLVAGCTLALVVIEKFIVPLTGLMNGAAETAEKIAANQRAKNEANEQTTHSTH